jgi:hypothetical protein
VSTLETNFIKILANIFAALENLLCTRFFLAMRIFIRLSGVAREEKEKEKKTEKTHAQLENFDDVRNAFVSNGKLKEILIGNVWLLPKSQKNR